jgi:prepilin-type N-terminal cleavage/methylation domain-containing protein
MIKAKQKGFTLIELLIVISIIGVLSSIAVVTYKNSREDARDQSRIVTFSQFRAALEDYYDEFEFYPCGDSAVTVHTGIAPNFNYYSFDSTGSTGFLNGGRCIYPEGGSPDTPNSSDGLADANYLALPTPEDPLNEHPHTFWYITPIEGRGEYLLWTTLENSPEDMANDGGECNNLYEVFSNGWLPEHRGAVQRALQEAYPYAGTCNI